jgi:hypothetical protein
MKSLPGGVVPGVNKQDMNLNGKGGEEGVVQLTRFKSCSVLAEAGKPSKSRVGVC